MTDWRAERDQALLALEREKQPPVRAEAADLLYQLAAEDPSRAPELSVALARLLSDAQGEVRRAGVIQLASSREECWRSFAPSGFSSLGISQNYGPTPMLVPLSHDGHSTYPT